MLVVLQLPHDVIAKQGEAASEMYYCVKGTVEVTISDPLHGVNIAALLGDDVQQVEVSRSNVTTNGDSRLFTVGEDGPSEAGLNHGNKPPSFRITPNGRRASGGFFDPRLALQLYGSPFAKRHQPAPSRLKKVARALRAAARGGRVGQKILPSLDSLSRESAGGIVTVERVSGEDIVDQVHPSHKQQERLQQGQQQGSEAERLQTVNMDSEEAEVQPAG